MLAGVVPKELSSSVANNLVNEIMNNREGHFATGLVGIPVFTEWAIKNQATELMYSMLKKERLSWIHVHDRQRRYNHLGTLER